MSQGYTFQCIFDYIFFNLWIKTLKIQFHCEKYRLLMSSGLQNLFSYIMEGVASYDSRA